MLPDSPRERQSPRYAAPGAPLVLAGHALAGKLTIVFDFKYDGSGPGKGGTGVLSVDGKEVDRKTMAHSVAFLMALDETFDIGLDTRTPVDDLEYQVPFAFTGTIDSLTIKTGHEQLTDADRQRAQHVLAAAHD